MTTGCIVSGFDSWWVKCGEPWVAARTAAGGTLWTTEHEERRKLWERRYQRPSPPAGLTLDLNIIRRKGQDCIPITRGVAA